MNNAPTTSPRSKGKKNKIRPKLKPIVSTDKDDDEGLGYGEWTQNQLASANNSTTSMNVTPTTSPRPKARKNKIRPKLKPIVSTNEDDDEGLGYGEWAPSPLKPSRQISKNNNWSGSEEEEEDEKEDEARDEDTMHAIQNISSKLLHSATTNEKEEEIELDEATQSKRNSFDNKLQLSESNTVDDEKVKVSDNRASNNAIHTPQKGTDEVDLQLQLLWSRIWKGTMLLLCIAIFCEVLSIAIITKMRLSHVELSSNISESLSSNEELISANVTMDENVTGEVLLWSSREENEEVPDIMEVAGIEEESIEPTIENKVPSEEEIVPATSVAVDVQYNKKDEGIVNGLPENELAKLEEDVTEDSTQPASEVSSSPEDEIETHENEYPSTQEEEGSESGANEKASECDPEADEHMTSSEEVTTSEATERTVPVTNDEDLDANNTLEVAHDEVADDESSANEQAGIRLIEEMALVETAEKVREGSGSDDEQHSAMQDQESESSVNELPLTDHEKLETVGEYLPPAEDVHDDIELNGEQPSAEDDESESVANKLPGIDSGRLETEEEHLSPSKEVPVSAMTEEMDSVTIDEELDAQITLDEGLGEESNANELADTDLVEVEVETKVESSDNNEQHEQHEPILVEATDGYERDSTSVKEASASGKQPSTNVNDVTLPSAEPNSVENEHANNEQIEEETTSEDGSDQPKLIEGSPSLDGSDHGGGDDDDQNVNKDVLHQQQQVPPRSIETKREFLGNLEKFEEAFESHEVIDALVGHVAYVVPKLLLKRILGAVRKVKERFLKKKQKQHK